MRSTSLEDDLETLKKQKLGSCPSAQPDPPKAEGPMVSRYAMILEDDEDPV